MLTSLNDKPFYAKLNNNHISCLLFSYMMELKKIRQERYIVLNFPGSNYLAYMLLLINSKFST